MPNSIFRLCILFSLLLLSTNARKNIGEYWRGVMKDEAMPQVLQGLLPDRVSVVNAKKTNCGDSDHEKEMMSSKSLKNVFPSMNVKSARKEKENFFEEFDQGLNFFLYDSDVKSTQKQRFTKELDQEPNLSIYNNGVETPLKEKLAKEFDQEPNLSVYDNGVKPTERFAKEIHQKPNLSVYDNGVKPAQGEIHQEVQSKT